MVLFVLTAHLPMVRLGDRVRQLPVRQVAAGIQHRHGQRRGVQFASRGQGVAGDVQRGVQVDFAHREFPLGVVVGVRPHPPGGWTRHGKTPNAIAEGNPGRNR